MQLQEIGKLSVDDPVAKHLPDLMVTNPAGADAAITIKQLLTHTAGLRSDGTLNYYWTELDFTTDNELNQEIRSIRLVSDPSTKKKYSNLGYALAGRVVEEVSGMPFHEYVKTKIITPLGMDATYFNEIPAMVNERLATGYGRRMPDGSRSEIPRWNANAMTAAFGMHSTLKDLITFVKWQMKLAKSAESTVLSPGTIREMRRAHWTEPDWSEGWGLGFQVAKLNDRSIYGLYGSVPGFFSSTYVDAEKELGVIVVANSMDAQPYLGQPLSIQEQAFAVIGPALDRVKDGETVPTPPSDWGRYYGAYRDIWIDVHVMSYEGRLAIFNPDTSDAISSISFLTPVDGNSDRFIIASGPDAQLVDEPVQFLFDGGSDAATAIEITGMGKIRRTSQQSRD